MSNYLKIKINSALALATGETLYVYIIGGIANGATVDYYSYALGTASDEQEYVATPGSANTVTAIPLSSLGVDAGNSAVSYFCLPQDTTFSGRIWFSTNAALLTISGLQVVQPNPSGGLLFDFVELTVTENVNVNCDTTQVVGLGIPITLVNLASSLAFPPAGDSSAYAYPNAVGIVPGVSLANICSGLANYATAIGLPDFGNCVQAYSTVAGGATTQWLMNPGYLVPDFDSSQMPTGLATCLDGAINQFFGHYSKPGNSLVLTFEGKIYTGTVVNQSGFDPGNLKQAYCALKFLDPDDNLYPIFYPYFSSNSAAAQVGAFSGYTTTNSQRESTTVLPPPPSWWATNGLTSALPASGQVFLCNGVFNDGNTLASDPTVLAALQNIVVTLLNRGLIPSATANNLIACTGSTALTPPPAASFVDNSPGGATSFQGANLIYTPSQIPSGTSFVGCSASGQITLPLSPSASLTQAFTENVVTVPNPTPTTNYCMQAVAQPNTEQEVQFAFTYQSAVWPTGQQPSLVAPITVTYPGQLSVSATFTTTDATTGITVGMNVFDLDVQNPAVVTAVADEVVTVQSTIGGLQTPPSTDTLIFGNFYPMVDSAAQWGWNAYAAFLHYGGNGTPAPYISNQGYAFAYDDDGGYSSDITVTFPTDANCDLGIYLGPLT